MKEIVFTFDNRGGYLPNTPTAFEAETALRLIVKPHEFELKLSGEVLRQSSCSGYILDVTRSGAVCVYDYEHTLLATAEATAADYAQVTFTWSETCLSLSFGRMETVDYYPHCDGEHDRWGTEWITQYEVRFDPATNRIEIVTR